MSELVLPDHLAPLLGSAEFIDVIGTSDPWVVPDGWLEQTQQELRRLVERLGPERAGETSTPYRSGLPRTLPFLWSAITYLPTPAPIFVGSHTQLAQTLLEPWYLPAEIIAPGDVHTYAIRRWDWLLDLVYNTRAFDQSAVPEALEVSIAACDLLAGAPTHRERATAAGQVLRRALTDESLIAAIQRGAWTEVDARWQLDHELVTDEDAAALPELRGWTSLLAWGLHGLDAAHAHLTDRVSRGQTANELIASMTLYDGIDELPAAFSATVGPARFQDVSAEIERQRSGFDSVDWLGDTRGWIARAMVSGEIDAARIWMAMATHVAYFNVRLANPDANTGCPNRVGFWEDVRAIFRPAPTVRNPFASRLQSRAPVTLTTEKPTPGVGERLRDGEYDDATVAASSAGRDRRPDGRAGRADRPGRGQGAGAAAGGRGEGRAAASRDRHAGVRPLAAHGVPRQPRHGEDDGGPAAGPRLRPARRARQRAPGRGQPAGTWSASTSATRHPSHGGVQPGVRRPPVRRRGLCSWCRLTLTATSATRRSRPCSS